MKSGKEYEVFVYEKFKSFFKDFEVIQNDKIIGKESGINREIDISISGEVNNIELLYLVQCKDYKTKPADIKTIGEFSSVIKDVGASKGFLICTSGFTKTIHQYARTLGIELLTVEDINSEKWEAIIEIPIIYIKNNCHFQVSTVITATNELVEKNKVDLKITNRDLVTLSFDGGKTIVSLLDYINKKIEVGKIDTHNLQDITFSEPNLLLRFYDVWVPAKFNLNLYIEKKYFLNYLKPDEYSQIRDHITKGIIPLKMQIKNMSLSFDEGFVEVDKNRIPVFTIFNVKIEENLFPIKELTINEITADRLKD
jgi:hypothetical protein